MLGRGVRGQFWFGVYGPAPAPLHVAFSAETREQVRQFHAAALAADRRDNGPPGIRSRYHPNYYAAFIVGPDGHHYFFDACALAWFGALLPPPYRPFKKGSAVSATREEAKAS